MIFLALDSAVLLIIVSQGRFSSLRFLAMTGTVGIYPSCVYFRRCSSFVDLFCYLHAFKNITCFLVIILPKVSSLKAGLILPAIINGVDEDLV